MSNLLPLVLSVDPQGEMLDAARACEADVFLETYGNTAEEWEEEYGAYESSSIFIALAEQGGDVLGAARLLLPSSAGFKSLDDTSRPPWNVDGYRAAEAAGVDLSRTFDFATIGVRRGLEGAARFASAAMFHAISKVALANDLPNAVMIMDEHARALVTAIGGTTHVLPGTHTAPYLGSPASTPLWSNVPQMLDNQRRLYPDAYRLITLGIGLDGISLPAQADYVLSRRFAEPVLESA
ncbi:hypothetical protein SAMN05892883_3731 [Jatrophihabitans sp. GAS493]|nr:hypothetical protein SAMN05892883_3731 [Jatrophihabitans sp. GAS493]